MGKFNTATVLECKRDYSKWKRELDNILMSEGLWKLAYGQEPRPTGNLNYEDGENLEDFLREFQDKVNLIGQMGRCISPSDLYTTLKAAMPSEYRVLLRHFSYLPEAERTYARLKEELLDDWSTNRVKEEAKSYRTRKALAATKSGSSSGAPRAGAVLLHDSGPLAGKPVVCFQAGCGGNHYRSYHRDERKKAVEAAQAKKASTSKTLSSSRSHRTSSSSSRSSRSHRTGASKKVAKITEILESEAEDSDSSSASSGSAASASDPSPSPPPRTTARMFVVKSLSLTTTPKDEKRWVLDSASEIHTTSERSDLSSEKRVHMEIEGIVEGASIVANVAGKVTIAQDDAPSIQLSNVHYHESITENLVSLQLLADRGATIILSKKGGAIVLGSGHVTIANEADVIPIERPEGTFWTMTSSESAAADGIKASVRASRTRPALSPSSKSSSSGPAIPVKKTARNPLAPRKSTWSWWHDALGHPAKAALKRTVERNLTTGMAMTRKSMPEDLECGSCEQGKSRRRPFAKGQSTPVRHRLEIVVGDLLGKASVRARGGELYALILADKLSRKAWVIGLKKKSDAAAAIIKWQAKVERRTGRKVLSYQSDQGELVSQFFADHCDRHGIDHRLTHPHTPKENSIAEHLIGVLKDKARATHIHSKLPPEYWLDVLKYTGWCHDRIAISEHSDKTSYEAFYKIKPDVSLARRIGEIGWVHIPKADRSRKPNAPRALKGRFIGIGVRTKGWIMEILKTRRVVNSRDVKFWDKRVEESDSDSDSSHDEQDDEWEDIPPPSSPPTSPSPPSPPRRSPRNADVDVKPGSPAESPSATPPPIPPPLPKSPPSPSPPLKKARKPRTKYVAPPRNEPRPSRARKPARADAVVAKKIYRVRTSRIFAARARGETLPKSRRAAMSTETADKWEGAEGRELHTIIVEKQAVKPVRLPDGAPLLRSIWVLSQKRDELGEVIIDDDGRIGGQKMRLVADGSDQDVAAETAAGYERLHSATARGASIRLVMGYAAKEIGEEKKRGVKSTVEFRVADFKGAYLNADNDRPTYIRIPESSNAELERLRLEGWVWEVLKALYGLCQSAALWGKMRDDLFAEQGYQRLESDGGMYQKRVGSKWIFVPSHVDDLLAAMNAIKLWDDTIDSLATRVSFSKVENLSHHLGCLYQFNLFTGAILISLPGYITDVALQFGMEDATPVPTPMVAGTYILKAGTPLFSVTGSTRMDRRVASRHPVAKRVLRYLIGTKTYGIKFVADGGDLKGNSDSSWASCPEERKSDSGNMIHFNGPIAWQTERQDDHALSSGESELYAAARLAKSTRAINIQAVEMGIREADAPAIELELDNDAAISMSTNPYSSKAIRHIDLRHLQIRQWVARNEFKIVHRATADMPSDLFTKALGPTEFQHKRTLCGVVDVQVEMALRW
ncbi:hypothetical protein RQP46_005564 [Phenoliferia psychrophenolica]